MDNVSDVTEIRRRSSCKSRVSSKVSNLDEKEIEGKNDVIELKKEVGLLGGLSLVVGSMIGSGIFLSPSGILAQAESVGASLCIWAGCGVLATLSALSYVELGLMIKKSGGEYVYLKAAFGDVIAFLLAWTTVIIIKPSSFAIISIGFSQYVTTPFYNGCEPPQTIQKFAAAFCIVLITAINCFSVKLSNAVQIFFTIAKLSIIAAIIVGGFVMIGQGNTEQFNDPFAGSTSSFSAIALGFYNGLWSYDGWNQLNYITEELQRPQKNFPLIIMIGIPLVTICYILVNIAYFSVMTPNEVLTSSAVAITFGNRVFGPASFIVPIAVACSTFGAANGNCFTASRLTFAAGRQGHMLRIFSFISVQRLTPTPALMFNCFIALIMIIPDASSFSVLIDYFTFASWIFYGLTFLSVIVLRIRRPKWKRPYRVFILIPAICFVVSIYLIIAPFLENPSPAYLVAAIFILAGLLFYFPLIYFKKVPPCMGAVTAFCQKVLEVVPPPQIEEEDIEEEDDEEEDDTKGENNNSKNLEVYDNDVYSFGSDSGSLTSADLKTEISEL